jgi:hypothetical protein
MQIRSGAPIFFGISTVLALLVTGAVDAQQAPVTLVVPPRTIADITAILDQEKPDEAKIAKTHADADAAAPAGVSAPALMAFYQRRAHARSNLGRAREAIADMEQAIAVGKGKVDANTLVHARHLLITYFEQINDYKAGLDNAILAAREADRPGVRGWLFSTYRKSACRMNAFADTDCNRRADNAVMIADSW